MSQKEVQRLGAPSGPAGHSPTAPALIIATASVGTVTTPAVAIAKIDRALLQLTRSRVAGLRIVEHAGAAQARTLCQTGIAGRTAAAVQHLLGQHAGSNTACNTQAHAHHADVTGPEIFRRER